MAGPERRFGNRRRLQRERANLAKAMAKKKAADKEKRRYDMVYAEDSTKTPQRPRK